MVPSDPITYKRVLSKQISDQMFLTTTCSSQVSQAEAAVLASSQTFQKCLISSWWMPCNKICCSQTIIRERKMELFLRKDLCSLVIHLNKSNSKLKFLRWLRKFKRNVNKFLQKFEVSNLFCKLSDLKMSMEFQIWILLPLLIQLRNPTLNQKLKNRRSSISMRTTKRIHFKKALKLSFRKFGKKTNRKPESNLSDLKMLRINFLTIKKQIKTLKLKKSHKMKLNLQQKVPKLKIHKWMKTLLKMLKKFKTQNNKLFKTRIPTNFKLKMKIKISQSKIMKLLLLILLN